MESSNSVQVLYSGIEPPKISRALSYSFPLSSSILASIASKSTSPIVISLLRGSKSFFLKMKFDKSHLDAESLASV